MKTVETTHKIDGSDKHIECVVLCTEIDIETLVTENRVDTPSGKVLPPGSFHVTITWEPDAPTQKSALLVDAGQGGVSAEPLLD
jgi:hypothetical protein